MKECVFIVFRYASGSKGSVAGVFKRHSKAEAKLEEWVSREVSLLGTKVEEVHNSITGKRILLKENNEINYSIQGYFYNDVE